MLNVGDTIGIIALSGDCEKDKIERAKINIEALGYNVVLSKNIFDNDRYLAGSDRDKVDELHNFFKNPKIDLILCARGGYGAIRLINDINYDLIKANPKPFCGFSDVTALLLMIYKNAGIVTYHSPMVQSDFADINENVINNFFNTINGKNYEYNTVKSYYDGLAQGILWGGNLATVVSLCGQDFLPDKDLIFFAEDINEPAYKIDKMFQQLFNINKFHRNCKGIVIGDFLSVDNEIWLDEYFKELSNKLQIPLLKVEGITHAENKITLPIGVSAKIENNKLILK